MCGVGGEREGHEWVFDAQSQSQGVSPPLLTLSSAHAMATRVKNMPASIPAAGRKTQFEGDHRAGAGRRHARAQPCTHARLRLG